MDLNIGKAGSWKNEGEMKGWEKGENKKESKHCWHYV